METCRHPMFDSQNFEANGINDYCYNLKRNQRFFEMYIKKNLKLYEIL